MTTSTLENPMTRAGEKRIVRGSESKEKGPKSVNLKVSRSLIISPNLDALLEYDKKIRGTTSPISPQLPPSTPLVGLPPPPRRTLRKPKSPTSPKAVGSPLVQESSQTSQWWDCENPYINPAPEFEIKDVLEESGAHGMSGAWSADGESCPVTVRDAQKASHPSRGSRKRSDKVLGIGKLLFNDHGAKAERKTQQLGDVSNTSPTPNLRERAGKGRLLKPKRTVAPLPGSNDRMHRANDDLVLDIRRHSSDSADDLDTFRRRPFLSRKRPSSQGSTSSSSHSSISTYEPASTIDAHISISSTMYPTSTVHSPTVLVDEPLPIVPPNRSSSLYSEYHARHSFIDIITPAVAEFTLPDHYPSPSPSRTPHAKPPLPTAPKPNFERPPPSSTTNFLDLDERNDLIRKNRKLAKVFGKPPGPDTFPPQNKKLPLIAGHQHASFATDDIIGRHGVWLPASGIVSTVPVSPDDDFLLDQHESRKNSPSDAIRASSPTSFIDLSDDLGSATLHTPKDDAVPTRGRRRSPSPSLIESLSPEQQAEETRRRQREKLARLHRFLGSRVPANLALGLDIADPGLPPFDPNTMTHAPETRKDWLRRRRSSSAAAYSSTWSDEIDRIKEDLNSAEKAINVRRAQKMEKVFGVAPPQTLYHTRRSPSPSVTNPAAIIGQQKSISGWTSPGESQLPVIGLRNINRSSYNKKKCKDNRPGTSESDKALLPKRRDSSKEPDLRKRTSAVYLHYQDSLNSLIDIIDRDDKESLAELHEYLNSGDMSVPPPLQSSTRSPQVSDRRLSNASIKSERRRSLPARTSIISVSSEHSIPTPRPEMTDFQARRRRAAKLTQFFGVDYRELITDVMESIESGLEHERKRGTLNPEEVEDLLARLRKLRTKRTGI
ncbi:hypothetical protein C0995_015146 [Termitomyces sp. Mi166|nr:hypothetical protein C0995_015146 [Termitomyces sp. Mi166\